MAEEKTTPEQGAKQVSGENEGKAAPQFGLKRVYVKDLSFEAPNPAYTFKEWQPKINQDLNTHVKKVSDTLYEVVLKITLTATQEDKTAFLVEVQQAGLFVVDGIDGGQLQHTLTAACPQILFPYAREAIDNLALRGGFPALAVPPINFDVLFARALEESKARAESEAAGGAKAH